ncbi:MAG TPA: lasso peptide biosynthesis B2 protein [Candidatus Saccharimonadales bacterium]|nr:lasso peptide biosynthesis B2 protein [Candidatus Saccharimonadales bacterium]
MWERLRRFSSLDSEARGTFLRAAILLPLISVSLKVRGFRATQGTLLRFLGHPQQASQEDSTRLLSDDERTRFTVRMVNAAVRHVWHSSTCLEKSLALWRLLKHQGIASELRIGGRKIDGKFEAHAWVEHQGIAVDHLDDLHRHYAPFDGTLSSSPLETQ